MAPISATTITADYGHFDPFVQQRFGQTEPKHDSIAVDTHRTDSNLISPADLDNLRSIAEKYDNLRKNLLRGGVGEDVIELLSQGDSAIRKGSLPYTVNGPPSSGTSSQPTSPFQRSRPNRRGSVRSNSSRFDAAAGNGGSFADEHGCRPRDRPKGTDTAFEPDDFCDGDSPPPEWPRGVDQIGQQQQLQRPQFDRHCTRTVLLSNLAEGTTHADITAVVRGGILLDVFMRIHEKSASISFLYAVDARNFFDHVRRHDLYLKNKRIDIKWCERQFILPGHVASRIAAGATRNLIIRQIDPRHNEQSIREDLDHIHNLVVMSVHFEGGNCHIKTNSVHNALYARMCMMSRAKYKNARIGWDVDECAQPYEIVPPQFKPRKEAPRARKNSTFAPNRFHLLNLDDDGEDEIPATFQSNKPVGITA